MTQSLLGVWVGGGIFVVGWLVGATYVALLNRHRLRQAAQEIRKWQAMAKLNSHAQGLEGA